MGTISFARGVPAPECLPVEELAECARAAIEQGGPAVLSYGPGGGYAPLRGWIAERYEVEPERVVLTNGSLQGFVFLAELLAPGKRVLVEAPTYDRPLRILARLGADVVALPIDEEGLDPEVLEQALRDGRVINRFGKVIAGRSGLEIMVHFHRQQELLRLLSFSLGNSDPVKYFQL